MSKTDEALADVRGWLCGNLSDREAGKVCGMLSVVSRRINELENENAKLRELLSQALAARELDTFFEYFEPHSFWVGWCEDVHEMGIEV